MRYFLNKAIITPNGRIEVGTEVLRIEPRRANNLGLLRREWHIGKDSIGHWLFTEGEMQENTEWFTCLQENDKRKFDHKVKTEHQLLPHEVYMRTPEEHRQHQLNEWWNFCTRIAFVEFNYGKLHEVRVWAGTGADGETKENTYRGQFNAEDARFKRLFGRVARLNLNDISHMIWSPMMDGGWDPSVTEPLCTQL